MLLTSAIRSGGKNPPRPPQRDDACHGADVVGVTSTQTRYELIHPRDAERLLARLTGPTGPDLSCEECFEQFDRYVELGLAGSDADGAIPGMQAHLEGCSACDQDHESLRALLVSVSGSNA